MHAYDLLHVLDIQKKIYTENDKVIWSQHFTFLYTNSDVTLHPYDLRVWMHGNFLVFQLVNILLFPFYFEKGMDECSRDDYKNWTGYGNLPYASRQPRNCMDLLLSELRRCQRWIVIQRV